jgi:hypothetical protein
VILTTNKKLTEWGSVPHDDDLAAAIVDQPLERGRIIPLDGLSICSRHLILDDRTDSMLLNEPDRFYGSQTKILFDVERFFSGYLDRLREKLDAWHAVKHRWKGGWYWEIKTDIARDERVDV